MNVLCDLCSSDNLEKIYIPPTTQRGLVVYACNECGLLQSIPRISHVEKGEPSTSSGADFGNIRYGKGFAVENAMKILTSHSNLQGIDSILEIGSGRGEFVRALDGKTDAKYVAVEPNIELIDYWDNVTVSPERFEDINLVNKYDLIILNHTLEHLPSVYEALGKIYHALNEGGYIYIAVPNIKEYLTTKDIVEEVFIDKHLYHFTSLTLSKYLSRFLFEDIIREVDWEIRLLCKKGSVTRYVEQYKQTMALNKKALEFAATSINEKDGVLIWGAGRIFDALVNAGLDVAKLQGIVDSYLYKYKRQMHGRIVRSPNEGWIDPKMIVICSREYSDEIKSQASKRWPNAMIKDWSDF